MINLYKCLGLQVCVYDGHDWFNQHLFELIMEGLLHRRVSCAVITPWFPCPNDVISTRMNKHSKMLYCMCR